MTICDVFFSRPPPPIFWAISPELQRTIKTQLEVVETFWDRFWKAYGPYFLHIIFASIKLWILMSFCNQNGLGVKISRFSVKLEEYRSGCKKCQILRKNLELERPSFELSKNGLRMFSRHFVHFLYFHTYPHAFRTISKFGLFCCFSWNFECT